MANIRIKDLANTASSTASDDFIGIDGATNGTRKLNAYSPSFGGNATVAGTLTVSGAGTSSFQSTTPSTVEIANTTSGLSASQFAANGVVLGTLKFGHPSDGEAAKFPSIVGQFNATDASFARKTWLNFYTSAASGNNLVASLTDEKNLLIGGTTDISGTSGLKVFGTTASMDTSSGALVVSGGVGVAGALYVGSKGQFQSNDDALSLKYSTDGGSCLLAWKNTSGTTLWSIGGGIDTRQDELVFRRGSTTVLNLNNSNNATFAGTLTVNGTGLSAFAGNVETVGAAASDRFFQTVASGTLATAIGQNTSGSTNAFGIASGNSYVGNAQNYGLAFSTNAVTRMTISNGSTGGNVSISSTTASNNTSSGALVVSGGVGVAGAIYLGDLLVSSGSNGGLATESRDGSGYRTTWYNPTGDNMQLDFAGIGTKFTITSAGDTTIAGKITTSAPTGGAGAWELGTYSSTAPSATGYVTIEIGGTVYKLLASNV